MTKRLKKYGGIILALSACWADANLYAQVYVPPTAKVTIKVIDEGHSPVPGAKVKLDFCNPRTGAQERFVGNTNAKGFLSAEGAAHSGPLGSEITKEGFYMGAAAVPFFRDAEDGKWQPWNETCTTILRKVQNPVPMYAKSTWIHVPQLNTACGYDLMAGDWVAPWGKGTVNDFVFTVRYSYTNFMAYGIWMDLSFSNSADGIQQTHLPKDYALSWFSWPRQAPEDGYQSSWHSELGKDYHLKEVIAQKFYFRVRTAIQDGKIVSALYGKLSEGFWLAHKGTNGCIVHLSYYLNPTPMDRNMEFDPRKNLFKSLSIEEAVKAP